MTYQVEDGSIERHLRSPSLHIAGAPGVELSLAHRAQTVALAVGVGKHIAEVHHAPDVRATSQARVWPRSWTASFSARIRLVS
jgi:hypothetical protein